MAEEREPDIQRVEELEDRAVVYVHYHNGPNLADEFPKKEILYSAIPNLPMEPELPDSKGKIEVWRETFLIKGLGRILAYHFDEWMETCSASMQGFAGGPYIAKEDIQFVSRQ